MPKSITGRGRRERNARRMAHHAREIPVGTYLCYRVSIQVCTSVQSTSRNGETHEGGWPGQINQIDQTVGGEKRQAREQDRGILAMRLRRCDF
jgi:hypothetical protein